MSYKLLEKLKEFGFLDEKKNEFIQCTINQQLINQIQHSQYMLPSQDRSETYNCPSCGQIRECILDQIPSTASYFLSFISIFLFGIWSLFIIPLIFQSTKVIVKRCYYCNMEIERQKFFAIPSLSDQVLQFKFGSCMVVLSRKYALGLLIVFLILFLYFEVIREQPLPAVQLEVQHPKIETSWLLFIELCGKFQIIDNGLRAKMHFDKQFHNRYINWKGYYVQQKQNHDPMYPFTDWVYIKMEPTESLDDFPDIVMGVSKSHQHYILSELKDIKQGQLIQFQADLMALGNDFNYHMLDLESLQVKPQIKELSTLEKYKITDVEIDKLDNKQSDIKTKQQVEKPKKAKEQLSTGHKQAVSSKVQGNENHTTNQSQPESSLIQDTQQSINKYTEEEKEKEKIVEPEQVIKNQKEQEKEKENLGQEIDNIAQKNATKETDIIQVGEDIKPKDNKGESIDLLNKQQNSSEVVSSQQQNNLTSTDQKINESEVIETNTQKEP